MNGDLSIALQPTTPNLAASAHRGAASAARTAPGGASEARTGADRGIDGLRSHSAGQLEARRLKSLITDPAMQVSTHHDEASGRLVLRVRDPATGELIKQLPADELLRLYAALRETLVDERA